MRKILYTVILLALFCIPVQKLDVAKLLPIRAVAMYTSGNEVILETDTGYTGEGVDARMALKNLKENTPAVVYLDTAEYLLVSEKAQVYVQQLEDMLKPTVKVCVCDAEGRVELIAKYLDVHGGVTELRRWWTK